MTTAEIIEIITTAGLDHHDFKCQYAADRANEGDLIWVAIAEMARTTAASRAAWKISGQPDPYLAEEIAEAA